MRDFALMFLGYIRDSHAHLDEALSAGRKLGHVYSLTLVLLWASWAKSMGGSAQEPHRHAEEALSLSNEHGFTFGTSAGLIFVGRALIALGEMPTGFTRLTKGLSAYRTVGGVASTAASLVSLAEAHAKLGRPNDALKCLTEAEQIVETTDERNHEADLHRLRGFLLNVAGDRAAAEQSYLKALAIAKQQRAKIFQLRASIGLARLWHDQGKRAKALNLLTPIYGWFTEGLDTPDLKEAKALLDELGS